MYFIFCCAVLLQLLLGTNPFILPGPCPSYNSTGGVPSGYYTILGVVPFKQANSDYFRHRIFRTCFFMLTYPNIERGEQLACPPSNAQLMQDNDSSFYFYSSIRSTARKNISDSLEIFSIINEQVGCFFWSCRNLAKKNHDEALIVLLKGDVQHDEGYSLMKEKSAKYFNQFVNREIIWNTHDPDDKKLCLNIPCDDHRPMINWIVMGLLALTCLCFSIKLCFGLISKTQVHPLT